MQKEGMLYIEVHGESLIERGWNFIDKIGLIFH